MKPEIGWVVKDCYMGGIGELSDIGSAGRVEAVGEDWVVVRNISSNKPIYVETNGNWQYYNEWEDTKLINWND